MKAFRNDYDVMVQGLRWFPLPVPGTAYWNALRAHDRIRDRVSVYVREALEAAAQGKRRSGLPSALDLMVNATDEDVRSPSKQLRPPAPHWGDLCPLVVHTHPLFPLVVPMHPAFPLVVCTHPAFSLVVHKHPTFPFGNASRFSFCSSYQRGARRLRSTSRMRVGVHP
jgi:hypothetical protein